MNLTTCNQQRQIIRQHIRQLRQSLSPAQQSLAEQNITQQALDFITQKQAKHIGLYLSFDGEISTKLLIQKLWQQNLSVYLPVLHPFAANHLLFLRYQSDSPLQKNKFGILEPKLDVRNVLPTNALDILFTPLVAFDKQGNRLGMGGGFYDRTLQNWQQKNFLPIGLAHQCQQVDALPIESWDIPLFGVFVG
ncbi:5-formyltetrahydrofolate cyclo-ligase [Avibacterium sp. 20-126]|uniref:5-formyltetrahydrofolate cyclo-ligase n=1 Tax=Avibacterium sp. 20-126 TaxID=2911524 RepID=UPI00218AE2B6|nr:5-formyltetrahydrofolate cyclo-ligase [Avibacterium sp. 20-126]